MVAAEEEELLLGALGRVIRSHCRVLGGQVVQS